MTPKDVEERIISSREQLLEARFGKSSLAKFRAYMNGVPLWLVSMTNALSWPDHGGRRVVGVLGAVKIVEDLTISTNDVEFAYLEKGVMD